MISLALLLSMMASAPATEPDCNSPVTLEINACARAQFDAADRELNSTYHEVLKSLSAPPFDKAHAQYRDAKQSLVKAQRAWVIFRQKDCDAVFNYWRDGTIRTSMYLGCMTDRTKKRTEELASLIEAY